MTLPSALGCSTISFQHLPLREALGEIARIGFSQIDLGALPGVCDHVPALLDSTAIDNVAADIAASGLSVRSVNGDIGDFNALEVDRATRDRQLRALLELTARIGAPALVLPCGALGHDPIDTEEADLDRIAAELRHAAQLASDYGVAIWVESLHYLRFCYNRERANALHARLADTNVRPILDLAHGEASGDSITEIVADWGRAIAHVHVRDATLGNFNAPFGTGSVDFAQAVRDLQAIGFTGAWALEMPSAAYSDSATDSLTPQAQAEKSHIIEQVAATMAALLTTEHSREGENS
ncbi:sugar phosphate isomerase/epimerase family protein [Microbacterium sp. YY-01]|uniref:sugar phosphate isomerase/epimerase family protein n=1 Tax=Microbacterium sp. YY-01 TaxID=3421634 RepID=UPI003D1654E0